MNQRLVIVGAGYTGVRLAELAVAAGYEVIGTTRSSERQAALRDAGALAIEWSSGDDLGPLRIDDTTTVVYSVPPTADTHIDDVQPFLAAPKHRFVYLSSASVYGDYAGQIVDEDSPRRPTSSAGKLRRDVEDAVLGAGDGHHVVRIVGIYGPGRTLDRYVASGHYKLVDGGEKLTNRIHVDDLARIVLAIAERSPDEPRVYLAADGHPVRVVDLIDWLVEHRGLERPPVVSLDELRATRGDDAADRWANSYAASNQRVRDELGLELLYPTVFDGYRAIFGVPERG